MRGSGQTALGSVKEASSTQCGLHASGGNKHALPVQKTCAKEKEKRKPCSTKKAYHYSYNNTQL